MNRTKKKVTTKLRSPSILHMKSLKIYSEQKKIKLGIRSQQYTATTVKFGTIFGKSRRSSVILKINGATPQLDQNLKPTRNLPGHFLYIYLSIYICVVFNTS